MARHNISSLSSRIRTLPPIARRQTTVGRELDLRDQTRRLSADGPARSHGHPTADPPRQRLVQPLPANRGGCEPPQGEVLPHRWRVVPSGRGRLPRAPASPERVQAFLYAFDLLELDGSGSPSRFARRHSPASCAKAGMGCAFNEHLEHPDGAEVFHHACRMGLEGIVSKRLGSCYRSGRSPDWLKFKNPEAPR